jgi:hypothetical protein
MNSELIFIEVAHAAVGRATANENGVRSSAFRRCRLKPELQTEGIFITEDNSNALRRYNKCFRAKRGSAICGSLAEEVFEDVGGIAYCRALSIRSG